MRMILVSALLLVGCGSKEEAQPVPTPTPDFCSVEENQDTLRCWKIRE
jgi:uncharacterized protein YcfL